MTKYTEIIRLRKMLEEADIPFRIKEYQNGYHLHSDGFTVDSFNTGWSVIEHDGSYGRERNLLEISGGLMTKEEMDREGDEVLGWLTAEDVFRRILDFGRSKECAI